MNFLDLIELTSAHFIFSMPHYQARPMYTGHNTANVQNSCAGKFKTLRLPSLQHNKLQIFFNFLL